MSFFFRISFRILNRLMKKPIFALADPDIQQAIFFNLLHAKNQIHHPKYHFLDARKKIALYFFVNLRLFLSFSKKLIKVWMQFIFFIQCFFRCLNRLQSIGASTFLNLYFLDNVYNLSYAFYPCYGCYSWDIFVPPPS